MWVDRSSIQFIQQQKIVQDDQDQTWTTSEFKQQNSGDNQQGN